MSGKDIEVNKIKASGLRCLAGVQKSSDFHGAWILEPLPGKFKGLVRTGQFGTGPLGTGKVGTGQVGTGKVRTGQVGTGKIGTGQVKTG